MAALYEEPKTSSWSCCQPCSRPLWKGRAYHFRFDAHRVKLLLVHGSGLCAIVRHKDKTLAYAVLGEYFPAGTKSLPFCLNISIVSGM